MRRLSIVVVYFCLDLALTTDCPDRWLAFEGSCYLFSSNQRQDFQSAETFCQEKGGHLVQVNNALENAFLKSELRYLRNDSYWIGLTDNAVEGTWVYYNSDDKVTFFDWAPGDPNSYNNVDEDCAAFFFPLKFGWVDAPCDTLFEPICEIKSTNPVAAVG